MLDTWRVFETLESRQATRQSMDPMDDLFIPLPLNLYSIMHICPWIYITYPFDKFQTSNRMKMNFNRSAKIHPQQL